MQRRGGERAEEDRSNWAPGVRSWHLRCAARARWGDDLIGLDVTEFDDPALLDTSLAQAGAVIHLAGVNRASDPSEIERTNPWLAQQLVASLRRLDRSIPIVYGNSIHALGDSVFGVSKGGAGGGGPTRWSPPSVTPWEVTHPRWSTTRNYLCCTWVRRSTTCSMWRSLPRRGSSRCRGNQSG